MTQVIIQNVNTVECRTVSMYCMLESIPFVRSSLKDLYLPLNKLALENGAMPVGSVEFCREAFTIAGLREPRSNQYPIELTPLFKRMIWSSTVYNFLANPSGFVKPVQTKAFIGFIVGDGSIYAYDGMEAIRSMDPLDVLYCSEVIEDIRSEYRIYVQKHRVIGVGRYDDSNTPDLFPTDEELNEIESLIAGTDLHTLTIDVGRLADGSLVLIECNQAWAIGLYLPSLTPAQYFSFLKSGFSVVKRNNL